jgi:orotate phosphoribosyltransferase
MDNITRMAILKAGALEFGKYRLETGEATNNRLNINKLFKHKNHLQLVLGNLATAVLKNEPDLLVGVPPGGTKLLKKIAKTIGEEVPRLNLRRERSRGDKTGSLKVVSRKEQRAIDAAENIVLLQGVVETHEITERAIAALGKPAKAVICLWDRTENAENYSQAEAYTFEALVAEHIPSHLEKDALIAFIQESPE